MFLLNLLLALVWMVLTGQFTPFNFVFGFVLAYGALWLFSRVLVVGGDKDQAPSYFWRLIRVLAFGLFFIWELILANVRVAIDVLRWTPRMEPAVVVVPLEGFSDTQITLLANFITLTPGTLSLDVVDGADSEETRLLHVHAMHAGRTQEAIERFRAQIQRQLAQRVQEVIA